MAGLSCDRDDQDIGSRLIVEGILRTIEDADIVLCDVSSHNPNVFLELGWALRRDTPYVLIKDDLADYSFDLKQQFTLAYDHRLLPKGLKKKREELKDVLQRTLADGERRYSMVQRMTISMTAIEALTSGDAQAQLPGDIRQQLVALPNPPSDWRSPIAPFRWPILLRKSMELLFAAKTVVEGVADAVDYENYH
jgi:hypothetical protein